MHQAEITKSSGEKNGKEGAKKNEKKYVEICYECIYCSFSATSKSGSSEKYIQDTQYFISVEGIYIFYL